MFKKVILLGASLFLLCGSLALAHPGRTDSSGGHTCRTNCEKWGLSYGEYHYHGGGGSKSSSSNSSSYVAVDTRSAEEKEADGYIWNGEHYYKQGNYYNALYYYNLADNTGYGWKINSVNESAAAEGVAKQANTYFVADQLAKAKQFYELLKQNPYYEYLYDVSSHLNKITERQAFLNAFGAARWYYQQQNYVNAVLLADQNMKAGLASNIHAVVFMKDAAVKLTQQAYNDFLKKDYETSIKRYSVIANANYAPADLKQGATKNVIVVQGYLE